jgi:hypothetical protein
VLLASGLLAVAISPLAVAKTGDFLREGTRNGTTSKETEIIANIKTTSQAKGGFAMRMSNLSSTGGGFGNGCLASAEATSKPCYRASNLSTGRAFEFNTNNGPVAGTITAGAGGDTKKPLTTNATGVATGLNADKVDGKDAADLTGAPGPKGDKGDKGDTGDTGAISTVVTRSATGALGTTDGNIATAMAQCKRGRAPDRGRLPVLGVRQDRQLAVDAPPAPGRRRGADTMVWVWLSWRDLLKPEGWASKVPAISRF